MQTNIRPFDECHEAEVFDVWYRSGKQEYSYLESWKTFSVEAAQKYFRTVIMSNNKIWTASSGHKIIAFLAMNESYLDRLYVEPGSQGKGWGSQLIEFAKQQSPAMITLHTHQKNEAGRCFYEKHGFVAVKFGISPAPESEPDVEYRWPEKSS